GNHLPIKYSNRVNGVLASLAIIPWFLSCKMVEHMEMMIKNTNITVYPGTMDTMMASRISASSPDVKTDMNKTVNNIGRMIVQNNSPRSCTFFFNSSIVSERIQISSL